MLQCIANTATQNNFGADDRQKRDILPTPENKLARQCESFFGFC